MEKSDNYKRIRPLMGYFKEKGTIADIKQDSEYEFNGEVVMIGWLVTNLRQEKRKGLLSNDLIELLNYMGMVWDGKDFFEEKKNVLLAWYLKYKTLSNLTQYSMFNYNGEDIDIGNDLMSLRKYKRQGILTDAQIQFCDMLDIVWSPNDREVVYMALVAYREKYGSIADIKVTDKFLFEGKLVNVGRQLNYLRTKYNKGLMAQDEIDFFNGLGMVWDKKTKSTDVEMAE